MNPTIPKLVEGIPNLGSYAPVIAEVDAVLADPESTIAHISEIIEKDADLSSRLLRLSNSSFYGFPNRLETISEAVTLIGIQQVYDLLLVSNVTDVFAGVAEEHVTMESFWRHSIACGVLARLLALRRQLPKPDKFFVAGLLHDIGRMVLFLRAPKEVAQIFQLYQSERCLLREAERKILDFDHADISQGLLNEWNYPGNLAEGVGCHHRPASAKSYPMEAAVVHVADFLAHGLGHGSSGEHFIPPLEPAAWSLVDFPLSHLRSIIEAADQQIAIVENTFLSLPAKTAETSLPDDHPEVTEVLRVLHKEKHR